jgi:hypothetical protein
MAIMPKDPLLSIGKIIVLIGQGLMAIAAAALAVGVPIVLFMQNKITAEMQAEFADPTVQFPVMAVTGVMILALAIVAAAFLFLSKLRLIINTVGEGDPFVPENAERLTAMAWLMLAIQILAIPTAAFGLYIAKLMEEQNASIDAGFDVSGIIMVITLFILARVFRQGAAMREDLEGTV